MDKKQAIRVYYRQLPRSAVGVCAVVVLFLGMLAIVGWYMDVRPLQALVPGSPPMPYFTALGFVLTGAGLLSTVRGYRLVPIFCGIPVALFFGYLLTEYSLWVTLGRLPLAQYLPLPPGVTDLGSQSAVVNLGMCMCGVALMRLPFISSNRPGIRELDMLTGFLFGVASAGIVAYRTAEGPGNEWMIAFAMPVTVALSFMMVAVALHAASTDPEMRSYARSELRLPVILTVALTGVSLGIWAMLILAGINSLGSSLLVIGLLVCIPLASQVLQVWLRRMLVPEPVNTEGTFRALVDGMGEGVLVCNRKGQVTLCNPAMREMLGMAPAIHADEDLGATTDENYRLYLTDVEPLGWEQSPLYRALQGDKPATRDLLAGGNPETRRTLRVLARPVISAQGKCLGAVLTATDISAQRRDEAVLKRYMDVVARTSRELEEVAHISAHHLQEPIREIVSYAQLLGRELGESLAERPAEYMRYLVEGAHRLKIQLNDLLTYLDLGNKRVAEQPVPMDDLVNECIAGMGPKARDAVRVIGNIPTVMGDRPLLLVLVQHLISNGLKFNRSEQPDIRFSAQQSGEYWVFRVADNGIGVIPEHSYRIFDIFQRLHVKEQFPGTGMGLSLCRKIVTLHGGDIWHEPGADGGSVFCFRLPLIPPGMGKQIPQILPAPDLASR